ncbi:FCD domain-containing protein [Arthrobacter sp. NPDC089319]|uniref:FadR/GntR family transcriptional regulator n=1 Tax=Arthrobacter sp. NPDC089319 TaxID=3155915 RepID=UPI00341D4AF4
MAVLGGGAGQVLAHLNALIDSGEMSAGSRLPAERTLATELACSRNDVRQALAHMESEGQITRHVGRGTFLTSTSISAADSSTASPVELMNARALLEPEIAGMAAVTANESDFREMLRCLEGGENNDDYHEFESWDMALHRSFAAATHNVIILSMMDLLHTSRNDPVWGDLKRKSFNHSTCQEYRLEHRAIVEALMKRDRDQATAAMAQHLASIRNNIRV